MGEALRLFPYPIQSPAASERFLRYCFNAKMIDRLPELSAIKVDQPPTLPLSDHQYERLLTVIPEEFPAPDKAKRVHALVRLMRHSGLAIQDAVTLEPHEIQKDEKKDLYRVETSRQKTGIQGRRNARRTLSSVTGHICRRTVARGGANGRGKQSVRSPVDQNNREVLCPVGESKAGST
jgi:site-specific recombinase XerD